MADRSIELLKLTELYDPQQATARAVRHHDDSGVYGDEPELSEFMRVSLKISTLMQGNEELVQKMETL